MTSDLLSFDLVIFDCDGVLVDSEALACVVHADVLTQHGYAITAEQVHDRFLGRSAREARFEVETELGRALPDAYTAQLKATIDRVFGESLQPVPHIAETLARLSQRICVASSGTPTRIRSSLGTTGLLDRFAPHLFSAMQVDRGKPAPDLFLFAAAEMGVPPARCVVIEDSIPGVTAARAAGMAVLGFHGGSHCRPATAEALRVAGANVIFDDMRQLPGLIGQIARHPGAASLT
ncbi:HAD superfamily hydrolase (TIGR01509 family) [Nitrobacteraceae bacterium AZCC 2161]